MAAFHPCNTASSLHKTKHKTTLHRTKQKTTSCLGQPQKPNKVPQTIAPTAETILGAGSSPLNSNFPKLCLHSKCSDSGMDPISKSMDPYLASSTTSGHNAPLHIGIIGLGEFGQFLAKAFRRQGHTVVGASRSDYSRFCQDHGITFFRHLDGLCEAQPDVVLVCSSILSTRDVVNQIPFHKLKPDTIFADVLSVKKFPKDLFLELVPEEFGILCTHPMFGKFSGKNSWEGLRFVYDKVRVDEDGVQDQYCNRFLSIFQDEGCQMIQMPCEEHDIYAAESQFITHTIAKILYEMNLESTPIDTKGYETLMELTRNATSHGTDLYDGLFMYNDNAMKQIEKLDRAFTTVKKKIFRKLRHKYGRQIEETTAAETRKSSNPAYFLTTQEHDQHAHQPQR